MREIRPSGSEGGARFNPLSLPYQFEGRPLVHIFSRHFQPHRPYFRP
jgi:hypothetical protein